MAWRVKPTLDSARNYKAYSSPGVRCMKYWYEDGKQLKAERKRLGLTQAKLAKLAGVTQALISAVEHGVEEMATQDTRRKIANELVQMRHNRIVEMGATPKTEAEKLTERIALLQRDLKISRAYAEKLEAENAEWKKENADWKKRYDVALELLHLKQRNIVSQSEYDAKVEAAGLEKLSDVDAETLRQEIEQHVKKGK